MRSIRLISRGAGSLLLCATLAACNRNPEEPRPGARSSEPAGSQALVRVTPVRPVQKTLVRRTEQPGRVEAFEETPLYSKLAGYVSRVHVDIGDPITGPTSDSEGHSTAQGQVLAELSIPELEEESQQKRALVRLGKAEVRQSTAAVQVASAALESARAKLTEVEAGVERAQADYDRCKSEFTRSRDLVEKGALTRQVVDEKENLFRAADAARKEVAAKVASAKAAVSEGQALLIRSEADLDASQQRLRVAEAEDRRVAALVGYTKIRAPYDGFVSARHVHTGHLVQPGTGAKPLLVVMRTDFVRIIVDVPEEDAVLIQAGSEARIRIPSLSAENLSGRVTRTSWMLDAGTRTLKTEIDIENPDGRLRPGMYAYADLKVAERTSALSLPHTALWTADAQTLCFTIDSQGRVERRAITTGIRAHDDVEIVSGLAGDEQVIGVNPQAFREGQQVEVVSPKTD